jgi:two-component system, cell cycle sensor histidine kinase PleC
MPQASKSDTSFAGFGVARLFALVGAAAICAFGALYFFLRLETSSAEIDKFAANFNEVLTTSLGGLVSNQIQLLLDASSKNEPPEKVAALRDELDRSVRTLSRDTGVLKIKIFNGAGITIYSTNRSDIGDSRYTNAAFQKALSGQTASVRSFREEFKAMSGVERDLFVLSSYVPRFIGVSREHVASVFEIYTDITQAIMRARSEVWREMGVVLAGLVLLYAMLLYTVRLEVKLMERARTERLRFVEENVRVTAAAEVQRRFLMAVSHELRTPLNAIVGFADMLRNEVLGPLGAPAYRGYANDIVTAGQRLTYAIGDILEISRLGASDQAGEPLELREVATSELVEQAVRRVEFDCKERGVELTVQLVDSLPKLDTDSRRFTHALVCLLQHAIRGVESGSRVQLIVRANFEAKNVRFAVIGTPGVVQSEADGHIAHFGGSEPTVARVGGDQAGLELPLARRLIESIGGRLEIASSADHRATLTLVMPTEKYQAKSADFSAA